MDQGTASPSWKRELAVILLITAIGSVPRLWEVSRLGLTHFDEGIYALSGLWSIQRRGLADIDPMVIPYAPPGFPILVGVFFTILGVSDSAAIAPSLLFGIATIPLVGLIGRRWFGAGVGAAAAALAAGSAQHVAFSRMALTDVSFQFVWLVAIASGLWFLERPRLDRAIVLGIGVGLAQNFKYNGVLVGVIVALVALLGAIGSVAYKLKSPWIKTFALGSLAALTAAVVYLPWYLFVERHAGYSALLAHQRGYFRGVAGWMQDLKVQLEQGFRLSGALWGSITWGALAAGLAWLAVGFAIRGSLMPSAQDHWNRSRFWIGFGIVVILFGLLPMLPWWLGLVLLPSLLMSPRIQDRGLACWWLVCSLITPLYFPYARLWLPLHSLGWLICGKVLVELQCLWANVQPSNRVEQGSPEGSIRGPWVLVFACLLASILCFVEQKISGAKVESSNALLAPTDSLKIALRRMDLADGIAIRCFASPSVRFYLLVQGVQAFPVGDLKALDESPRSQIPWLVDSSVIDDPAFEAMPEFVAKRQPKPSRVQTETYELNPPSRLDQEMRQSKVMPVSRRYEHLWLIK